MSVKKSGFIKNRYTEHNQEILSKLIALTDLF